MSILFILVLMLSAEAQNTVPITGQATVPAGTFESPLTFSPPLARIGNSVTCPGCGGASGGSGIASYSCTFSAVASISCTHNLGVPQIVTACFDNSGNLLGGSGSAASVQSVVINNINQATITLSNAATGTCLISTGGIGPTGAPGPAGIISQIQNQGVNLIQRAIVNFTGTGVTCTDSGALTVCTIPAVGPSLTPPVQANWTAFNVLGMTQSPIYTANRWEFTSAPSTGHDIQGIAISAPTTPYTKTLRIWPFVPEVAYATAGFGWSDGTKYQLCEIAAIDPSFGVGGSNGGFPLSLNEENYSNTTTRLSTGVMPSDFPFLSVIPGAMPTWIQLADSGTNKSCAVSWDGSSWYTFYTASSTSVLSVTTQIVVTGDSYVSNKPVKVIFDSYQ